MDYATKYCGYSTLWRCFIATVFICTVILTNISMTQKDTKICKPNLNSIEKSNMSHLHKNRGAPYLAFIISMVPVRFNATHTNLNNVLPGYFNIQHKQPVSTNDSRIISGTSKEALALLLTYIDLWSEIGAKAELELTDDDWIFLFEDDVNTVPFHIIEKFHPQIYAKWNYSNPNSSIAGPNRFLIIKCSSVCVCCIFTKNLL